MHEHELKPNLTISSSSGSPLDQTSSQSGQISGRLAAAESKDGFVSNQY
jgi:hypothetical protein